MPKNHYSHFCLYQFVDVLDCCCAHLSPFLFIAVPVGRYTRYCFCTHLSMKTFVTEHHSVCQSIILSMYPFVDVPVWRYTLLSLYPFVDVTVCWCTRLLMYPFVSYIIHLCNRRHISLAHCSQRDRSGHNLLIISLINNLH